MFLRCLRIAILVAATAAAVGCTHYAESQNEQAMSSDSSDCANPVALYEIEPAITVEQAEEASLEEMKSAPHAPQIPFGYSNDEWIALKALIQPGDTLHNYTSDTAGGLVLVRNGCVIGHQLGWIS